MRNPISHTIRFSDFLLKWKIATYFIPLKRQRYERNRPFQENNTDVLGTAGSERCALCEEVPQPSQELGRLCDPHSELCAEKRLQRLHGRRDFRTSHPLL